jgi:glucose-1-phosphate thymidylyltransferase
MKIIIPMAGIGKRMRPHTLITPKPLLPVMGKPIVEILINTIATLKVGEISEVDYIVGDFGEEVEQKWLKIASDLGYPAKIFHQEEALGTAHALFCAKESLEGSIFVAFADTLFKSDIRINPQEEVIIWTKKIEDPSLYGVVVTDKDGYVTQFAEKPKTFVSDHAIIGLYYFRDAKNLLTEIDYLIKNDIRGYNEYQITDALENLRSNGVKIKDISVDAWFDCGNKNTTVQTNSELLKLNAGKELISKNITTENSVIIKPCYVADGVSILNSIVGPYVSVGKNTRIENSVISGSIIMENTVIKNACINNSMIGSDVKYSGQRQSLNIGDFSEIEE